MARVKVVHTHLQRVRQEVPLEADAVGQLRV